LLDIEKAVGKTPTDAQIEEFVHATLKRGQVIPGFGHAVLRKTDPRYVHLRQFAERNIKNDHIIDLCR